MTKSAARKLSSAFMLILLAAPAGMAFAQNTTTPSASPSIVTGTDPEPGPWKPTATAILTILFSL